MCVTSDGLMAAASAARLNPSTWNAAVDVVVNDYLAGIDEARAYGSPAVQRFIRQHEDMHAYHQTMYRLKQWSGAYAEALMRAYGFAQRGEAQMARHWYACAKRRAAFVVETQATAIALASK